MTKTVAVAPVAKFVARVQVRVADADVHETWAPLAETEKVCQATVLAPAVDASVSVSTELVPLVAPDEFLRCRVKLPAG